MRGIITGFAACAHGKVWIACNHTFFQTEIKVHILITGGTGLIGRQLCKTLLAEGHELTVLSRNPASVPAKCGAGVHAMAALDEWRSDRAFDAIINLAGEPIVDARWTAQRKQVLWDSRVSLTDKLVQRIAAARHKPGVLLSGSAVGYYGNRGDAMLDESAAAGEDFAARLCKAWEDAALGAESAVARVCLLRTGLVLSRHGGLLGRMLLPFRLGLGARLGDGKQWMSWVHIDDYVGMLLSLLRNAQASGPYNMTAPQPVPNKEFHWDPREGTASPRPIHYAGDVVKTGHGRTRLPAAGRTKSAAYEDDGGRLSIFLYKSCGRAARLA